MKKFFALLLALALALSLPACGSKTDNDGSTLDQTQQQETDGDDNAGNTPDQSERQEDDTDDAGDGTSDQSQGQEDNEDDNGGSTSDQNQPQGDEAGDNGGSTPDQPQQKPAEDSGNTPAQPPRQEPTEGGNSGSTPNQPPQQEPAGEDNSGSTPNLPPQQEPAEGDNGDSTPGLPPQQESPDLNRFYEDFMISMGDDAPGMIDLSDEVFLDQFYPGLTGYGKKQTVVQGAAISMVAFEFALVELENAADAQAVSEILQSRIDSQVEGGAFYPMTIEKWEKAKVIIHDDVAALICAGDWQAQAEEAFNALFR